HPLSVAPSKLKAPINPFTPRALSAGLARDRALPGQLRRARARSYVVCTAITDGGYSHAFNTSAKQSNLRRLV
ncbi:hypothetical protein VDR89_20775, partial [Xanthomonas campestris pv. campestris]|nr:hypothetical protein [Xanthomonas campestris pv. campestris]